MIPSALNSESHTTQILIQNEVKTTEIKTHLNKNISSMKYSDLLKQENVNECDNNAEISKNINEDTDHSNAQKCGKLLCTVNNFNEMEKGDMNIPKEGLSPENKNPGPYQIKYWVQYSRFHKSKHKRGKEEPSMSTTTETGEDKGHRGDERLEYTPSRNSFVAKVFSITFFMIIVTITFVATALSSKNLKAYFSDPFTGKMLFIAGVGGMLFLNCKVICSPCMRMFPCNIIIVVVAVTCMSLVTAYLTAIHETRIIIYGMIATAVTVLICYFLAFTSFDFTQYVLYIFAIGITIIFVTSLILAGMLHTGIRNTPTELALLFIGTVVIVIILIMKLQMILGGKTFALSVTDYTVGAFMLYTSVIDLFLRLLQMLGITLIEDDDLFNDDF